MADETDDQTPNPVFLVDDSTKEFFETYVGPGKKYPNVGELAKAYANADNHIHALTLDAGKFKTEAESLKGLLMENIINPKPNEDPNSPPNDDAPPAPPQANDAPPKEPGTDIKALVKEALGEVSTEQKRKDNARMTEEATLKRFGDQESALKAVQAKAEELGVSAQWIANQAFESPKAYFAIMGFEPDVTPKSSSTPAPSAEVNPQRQAEAHPGGPKPNSYKWFMEMRRTDPARFRSKEVQAAIMKAAADNPDFYN